MKKERDFISVCKFFFFWEKTGPYKIYTSRKIWIKKNSVYDYEFNNNNNKIYNRVVDSVIVF